MSLLKGAGKQGLLSGRQQPAGPQGAEGTSTQAEGQRTAYQKKAAYLGLRHQDTLDDLVKALRRHDLPDDRSMIMRALIDMAAEQLKGNQAEDWVAALADACRQTLPGTTKG